MHVAHTCLSVTVQSRAIPGNVGGKSGVNAAGNVQERRQQKQEKKRQEETQREKRRPE